MKHSLLLLLIVNILVPGLCVSVAEAAGTRECKYVGPLMNCGEASSLVICKGFDQAYYMANDQRVTNLHLDVYTPPIAFADDYGLIKNPKAPFRDYEVSMAKYSTDFLSNYVYKPVTEYPTKYRTAIKDIQDVTKQLSPPTPVSSYGVILFIGTFDIPANAKLYASCDKTSAVTAKNASAINSSLDLWEYPN